LQAFREQALMLLCLSGLSGLPQITLPLAQVYGAPLGVSLIGPRGSDKRLVDIALKVMG
ncbi:MAG: amidase, partial [Pseudomonadota bacterium]